MSHYLNSSGRGFLETIDDCVADIANPPRGNLLQRGICQLKTWDRRYRQRRQLRELDAALLRDIGISDAEAGAEASKPFWKA